MPRRISRKPTSSPSGTLTAPSPLETRPAEGTATSQDAQIINRATEWTLSPTEDFAPPIVGDHHHHSLPSPVHAQNRVQPGSTRILTPPPPRRDSDQVRRRLQSLQEHISAFLGEADSDGRVGSVIEGEVLAARLAEAGTLLRGSLRVKGQAAESGSSAELAGE